MASILLICCQALNANLTSQINSHNQLHELTTELLAAKEECEAMKKTLHQLELEKEVDDGPEVLVPLWFLLCLLSLLQYLHLLLALPAMMTLLCGVAINTPPVPVNRIMVPGMAPVKKTGYMAKLVADLAASDMQLSSRLQELRDHFLTVPKFKELYDSHRDMMERTGLDQPPTSIGIVASQYKDLGTLPNLPRFTIEINEM